MHLLDAAFYPQLGRITLEFKPEPEALDVLKGIAVALQKGERCFAIQTSPHTVLLDQAFYETELKPLFAKWTLVCWGTLGVMRLWLTEDSFLDLPETTGDDPR